jgi:NAD(P)-dependent dehydrogenase (short-subunit alcohol dehydrogenase family)
MAGMTTTLITGANKGIGREATRRLLAEGHDVWMAARDPALGQAAADELGGRFVQLDVTDDASVEAAVEVVRRQTGTLDVLVNNAGIAGTRKPVPDVAVDDIRQVFETNVFGIVRVTHAFLPLLESSDCAVIVNVSSGLASLTNTADPARPESGYVSIGYPVTKTAVNMITAKYAAALPTMRVNAVEPGYTATDLNGHQGTQTVEEGAEIIVEMATLDGSGPTGTFVSRHGPVAW